MAESQLKITDKNIDKTEAQLKKYYSKCFKSIVSDFEATYDKLLATVADGKQPTPADLYKLDRYWQLQAQLSNKLTDLGEKQAKLLSKDFENQWKEVYDSIALPSSAAFSSMSDENARQMVNQVWCADGKSWSQRVWNNTDRLKEELNEELIKSVITGKDTRYLKNQLMERFSVSNYRAKTLVKTEMAHIQTQAAAQRYKDYGVEYYEFYADTDERTCSQCGALDKKKFKLSEMKVGVNCPPMHPNDRCCIVPVIDKENMNDIMNKEITISSGEASIGQRNTGKGNPNAILTFGIELNNRQKELLDSLPKFDSSVIVSKKSVKMSDLSALTALTGDEFAMFTNGKERLIIRGNTIMVNVNSEKASKLAKEGYKLSGHTHPGTDYLCMQPSDGDYTILSYFNQKESVIYNSKGSYRIYYNRG